jgi:hypothetical protein
MVMIGHHGIGANIDRKGLRQFRQTLGHLQGSIAGQNRTSALGHRKQYALGAGRRISRGRLPPSRGRSSAKFRHPAPNCPQPAKK